MHPLQYLVCKFHGQQGLAGYTPWGHKKSDMAEHTDIFLKKWLFLTSEFLKFQVGLTEYFFLNLNFFPGEVAKISSLSSNSLPVLDLNSVLRNLRVRKKHFAFALNRLGNASVNITTCQWLYGRHMYSLSPYKSCLGRQDLQAGWSRIYMATELCATVSFLTAVEEEASWELRLGNFTSSGKNLCGSLLFIFHWPELVTWACLIERVPGNVCVSLGRIRYLANITGPAIIDTRLSQYMNTNASPPGKSHTVENRNWKLENKWFFSYRIPNTYFT